MGFPRVLWLALRRPAGPATASSGFWSDCPEPPSDLGLPLLPFVAAVRVGLKHCCAGSTVGHAGEYADRVGGLAVGCEECLPHPMRDSAQVLDVGDLVNGIRLSDRVVDTRPRSAQLGHRCLSASTTTFRLVRTRAANASTVSDVASRAARIASFRRASTAFNVARP